MRQNVLKLLICGEIALELFREFLGGDLVVGYADRCAETLESITGKDSVFFLADE